MAAAAIPIAVRAGRGQEPGSLDARRVAFGLAAVAAATCGLFVFLPSIVAVAIALPLLSLWILQAPVRGIYVLVAGAAMIEIFPLGFADSLTDRVPMFLNLNNSAGLDFPITPAEILMLVTGVVAVARDASERRLRWPRGGLFKVYCIYIAVVLAAELHGLLTGGDFKLSLWEMRPQIYGFIAFMLAGTLLEDREQLKRVALIFLFATFAKALIAVFRYFVTLHGDVGGGLQVLAHEDSYFLGMFVTAAVASAIWIKNRRVVTWMGIGAAICAVAMLANSRRAGVFAGAGAVAVVVMLAYKFEPSLRKRIAWAAVVAMLAGIGFVAYAWNKEFGIQAQLVRPIRSLVDPSARDLSSDDYRTAETANLLFTYRTSPLIGVGFGSPFYLVYPMVDISDRYPFWNVIPHNSLLWVGMRMGAIGFLAFWALIGFAVLTGFGVMRARSDPLIRAVAAFALAGIAAEIAVAYTDIQLENYRNLIFLGVILGVLYRLPQLQESESA